MSVQVSVESLSKCSWTGCPSAHGIPSESPVSYEELLRNPEIISQMLGLAIAKLDDLRKVKPDAGGLVVATDVEHAHQVALALEARGESCRIVTNRDKRAQDGINEFRHGASRWIVAVGMISEGTDIPRLQVCCYLSRIRTELHYRQVLGRVLRRTGAADDQAWLYVLAESTLEGFSQRVADDLPEDLAILSRVHAPPDIVEDLISELAPSYELRCPSSDDAAPSICGFSLGLSPSDSDSTSLYRLSFSQRYHYQLLALF